MLASDPYWLAANLAEAEEVERRIDDRRAVCSSWIGLIGSGKDHEVDATYCGRNHISNDRLGIVFVLLIDYC